jgi:acyl-CoA thioester hydrolase
MRFVAQTSCVFLRAFAYPQPIEVGLSITKLGRSSATYGIGLFSLPLVSASATPPLDGRTLCAEATFTHVYVDENGRPMPIPPETRQLLETLVVSTEASPDGAK